MFSFSDSLFEKIKEYSIVTPISTDSEGNFLSHEVSKRHKSRFQRDVEDFTKKFSDTKIYYNVTIFGKEFHLRLKLNSKLIAPGATMEWEEDSNVRVIELHHKNCFYIGDITDLANASVAISNCDGLVSFFYYKQINKLYYSLRTCRNIRILMLSIDYLKVFYMSS